MANQALGEATCWLEQVEGIIDLVTAELDKHKETCGGAVALSLYGAASLVAQARQTINDEDTRLSKGGR